MNSIIPPQEEARFIRDVRNGVRFGKWALPIIGTIGTMLVTVTMFIASNFYSIVNAQESASKRLTVIETKRTEEAAKREEYAKEQAARLEQQSRDIAVLMAMVADVRDVLKDMNSGRRRR